MGRGHTRSVFVEHSSLCATVEPRIVVENERLAINGKTVLEAAFDPPVTHLPGSDVASGVAYNVRLGKEGRREIDPALVGKQPSGDIGATEFFQPIPPPLSKAQAFRRGAHTEEPEVIHSVLECAYLVVEYGFQTRFWVGEMWCKKNRFVLELVDQHVEVRKDHDVGIEVEGARAIFPLE